MDPETTAARGDFVVELRGIEPTITSSEQRQFDGGRSAAPQFARWSFGLTLSRQCSLLDALGDRACGSQGSGAAHLRRDPNARYTVPQPRLSNIVP
jgi:hypothetical protein